MKNNNAVVILTLAISLLAPIVSQAAVAPAAVTSKTIVKVKTVRTQSWVSDFFQSIWGD